MKTVMEDLVDKRNAKVLAEFDKRLDRYDTVVVPWGALHMPKLERSLKDRGFKIERNYYTLDGTPAGPLAAPPISSIRRFRP